MYFANRSANRQNGFFMPLITHTCEACVHRCIRCRVLARKTQGAEMYIYVPQAHVCVIRGGTQSPSAGWRNERASQQHGQLLRVAHAVVLIILILSSFCCATNSPPPRFAFPSNYMLSYPYGIAILRSYDTIMPWALSIADSGSPF